MRLESYTPRPNANAMRLTTSDLSVWFSYSTPIAFFHPDCGIVVRENVWGPTTGKHIGIVERSFGVDRSSRVESSRFVELMDSFKAA
jgi:hypothetical protein